MEPGSELRKSCFRTKAFSYYTKLLLTSTEEHWSFIAINKSWQRICVWVFLSQDSWKTPEIK
jgi:hypothetical protein